MNEIDLKIGILVCEKFNNKIKSKIKIEVLEKVIPTDWKFSFVWRKKHTIFEKTVTYNKCMKLYNTAAIHL